MRNQRVYCPYCSNVLAKKPEEGVIRDHCAQCKLYFYDNPLPVVSSIVAKDQSILLVKRKNEPYKGEWCLPSGFAETGESIEDAALRELEEETGIKGKTIGLVDVDSNYDSFYGDLFFITYEVEWIDGDAAAGDDAIELGFFSIENLPDLAFESNTRAVESYIQSKHEYWAIVESFKQRHEDKKSLISKVGFLAGKLIRIIHQNADVISLRWLEDVRTNNSTPNYARFSPEASVARNRIVIEHFGKWLEGEISGKEIRDFYRSLGAERKREGFGISEVISALSLTRKYIWEFALAQQMWTKTIDIFTTLEIERSMMLFFDKATYHVAKGFEDGIKQ